VPEFAARPCLPDQVCQEFGRLAAAVGDGSLSLADYQAQLEASVARDLALAAALRSLPPRADPDRQRQQLA
jgi:hypothetical protein